MDELMKFNLSKNILYDEGASAIANALIKARQLTNLIVLNLGYNNIKAAGGEALAKMLIQNSTLTSLSLAANKLG